MGVFLCSQLGGDTGERPAYLESNDSIHVRVMAEQRDVGLLGDHADAGRRMPEADGAEQRSGQEDIADRAEPHGEHVRRGGRVGHGGKVQREW
jgi:hypothetical protein